MLMKAERNIHLKENTNDKGNDYYERKSGTPVGAFKPLCPKRLKKRNFRPLVDSIHNVFRTCKGQCN